jgi:hypothetical protein
MLVSDIFCLLGTASDVITRERILRWGRKLHSSVMLDTPAGCVITVSTSLTSWRLYLE